MRSTDRLANIFYLAVPLAVAAIAEWRTDFGHDLEPAFMAILAQVIPVIWIASLIETSGILQRSLPSGKERDVPEYVTKGVASTLRSYLSLFVVAESLALYSIATDRTTTFILVAVVLATFWMLVDLYVAIRQRLGITPIYLEIAPKVHAARLSRKAAALRQEADELERAAGEHRGR